MLKEGDKVRIRPRIKGGKYYGDLYFDIEMEKYRGKIATIIGAHNKYKPARYDIDLDKGHWVWNEKMFTGEKIESEKEAKFKVGQKVGIKDWLEVGEEYGGIKLLDTMVKKYEGVITNISEPRCYMINGFIYSEEMLYSLELQIGDKVRVDEWYANWNGKVKASDVGTIICNNGESFGVEFERNIDGHSCGGKGKQDHCWNIAGKFLIKLNEIEEEVEEKETGEEKKMIDEEIIEKLSESIDKLAKEVKKEDPFKQAMLEGIIEKGKELATEDLKKEIKEDLDEFIKETYGMLPKKIVVQRNDSHKELEGIFHKDFEKICKIVDSGIPLMLVGGAGAGKNYTLEQVAQALDLTFYTTNAVNQDYKLTGFIDANGVYHETEFYKAFVNGGMFFLDEVDASCPEALVTLNSAIANGYFDFPTGRVVAHKDFRVVCAGNTYGTGADMVYVGRNVLDGATLDRFVVLEFDYDDEVEKQLAYDDELYRFIRDLRNAVNKAGLRYIVSMRALINSTKLLNIGVDKNTILKTTVIKNMQKDDLNTVIGKLEDTSSDWYKELKRLCD